MGVGLDESTDRSQEKHLAIIIRYINPQAVLQTKFLELKALDNCDADSLLKALQDSLRQAGVPMKKVVGLGTDGAAVMTGIRNGLPFKQLDARHLDGQRTKKVDGEQVVYQHTFRPSELLTAVFRGMNRHTIKASFLVIIF